MTRRKKRLSLKKGALLLAAGGAALFALGYGVARFTEGWGEEQERAVMPAPERPPRPSTDEPQPSEEERSFFPDEPPAPPGSRVALIIDDLGRSLRPLEALFDLGVPITYAVLPFEARTPEVMTALRHRQAEVLCHLPMEPLNGANPGPGALTRDMTGEELAAGVSTALDAVPGARGVNNHMGSRFTADPEGMISVLGLLRNRGLYFVDSRTTAASVGYRLALELGIPATERHVFLDGDPAPEAIREQFRRLLAVARERGSAVAIGHPRASTIEVLEDEVPRALELGFRFVPVGDLLVRSRVASRGTHESQDAP